MEERAYEGTSPYRLLYSLNSIETLAQSMSDNRQTGYFPVPALIIVTDGQGWVEADGQRYPLDKGAGFQFERGALDRISAGEQGLSFYRLHFEVLAAGDNGGLECKACLTTGCCSPVRYSAVRSRKSICCWNRFIRALEAQSV